MASEARKSILKYHALDVRLRLTSKHHIVDVFGSQFVGPDTHTVSTVEHGSHEFTNLDVAWLVVIYDNACLFVYPNREMFEGSRTAHGDGVIEEEGVERPFEDDGGFGRAVPFKAKPTSMRYAIFSICNASDISESVCGIQRSTLCCVQLTLSVEVGDNESRVVFDQLILAGIQQSSPRGEVIGVIEEGECMFGKLSSNHELHRRVRLR